ncbi:MAG: flagellar assembly protein FliH [Telmatospirillum sp.]|nr:flagellar assembly protein FliH [Telmatospirillum sp.]
MAKLQKFLFDLDFDAPPPEVMPEDEDGIEEFPEEEVEEPPPPPMFSEEELALTRDQAFAAGHQAGVEAAEAATERLLAETMMRISAQLDDIAAVQADANESRLRESVAVAVAVIRKLQPEMGREHALDEIAGVVRECLAHIEKDVRVTIRVNPAHMDSIRHYASQAAETTGFEGRLIYSADARLVPGDCRIEWGDGGAERDVVRLWAEIDATIARALGREAMEAVEPPPAGEPPQEDSPAEEETPFSGDGDGG